VGASFKPGGNGLWSPDVEETLGRLERLGLVEERGPRRHRRGRSAPAWSTSTASLRRAAAPSSLITPTKQMNTRNNYTALACEFVPKDFPVATYNENVGVNVDLKRYVDERAERKVASVKKVSSSWRA
jgi:hypothetical protein